MNTDQQTYYTNPAGPYQAPNGYYQSNGIEQHFSPRSAYAPSSRMPPPYYNQQGPNSYGQQPVFLSQPYFPNTPYIPGTDPQNSSLIRVVRPSNEAPNGAPNYIPSSGYQTYANTNFQQSTNMYPQRIYPFPMQPIQTSQSQYSPPNNQPQTQSSNNQQYGSSSQSQEKRPKKPLAIVDPVSQKAVELKASTPPSNGSTPSTTDDNHQKDSDTELTNQKSIPPAETTKTKKQEDFRQDFARQLHTNAQTDKNGNNDHTNDIRIESTIGHPQPGHPGIRTRSVTDDKLSIQINQDNKQDPDDTQKQVETISINSESTPDDTNKEIQSTENSIAITISQPTSDLTTTTTTQSVESVTSTPSTDTESESITIGKTSKRHRYSIQELLDKRSNPVSKARPENLPYIPDIVQLPPPPAKQKPVNKKDANDKFLRDVRAILNKLTPQNKDKLLKQLEELELDRPERLEGMINIIFSKAVEEPKFCPMYSELCKKFQKKQVTVPSEDGETVTYYFRQILLTRCQNGFQSDYRTDINYDNRKKEVDAITDEKKHKEEAENLEEALFKAKRRNFGNILFIGELFKEGMLIDMIMYECMENLLQDKTDEENLECLCKLLTAIGKELEAKANDKSPNRKILEKNYAELENIVTQKQGSARARFMIQDLMDLRKANWVARLAEAKPVTIDEIHEQERIRLEQQERDQERDRQQRREQHRGGGANNNYGANNQQQYTGSRGSRGSGFKQQSNRTDEERPDKRFSISALRQYQSNDKRNQGSMPLNFAPQGGWPKVSGNDKKNEDDRSNANRTGKPPANSTVQQLRSKNATSPGTPGYAVQRQPSRELARENSPRDREKAMESLRNTTSGSGVSTPKTNSRNVSREESRNASPESNISERTSNANMTVPLNKTSSPLSTTINNTNVSFDEEKTQASIHSLFEEYTENYSDNSDRPVTEAIEELSSICASNINQQAISVRELFTNVLEAKPRARKAIGHLLDAALQKNIISNEGFLSGLKMVIEVVPDYAVDIPLIWQYIGEILGAFIGAPSSNMFILKAILQLVPDEKSKQLFQYIIRYATEFSSKSHIQALWQSADFSLNDFFQSDSSFINEYNWLSEPTTSIKGNSSPQADPQLIKLFKSVNDQGATVTEAEIHTYIQKNMNPEDKFYIRNIVLSYLEACLVNRDQQKKIQEDIAKKRMTILNEIIEHRPEAELQAVYAIQNFVSELEHPQKMARLLFDLFYDDECVSEETFHEWRSQPDQSETEGHSIVVISTNDFFTWLQQADDGEEVEN